MSTGGVRIGVLALQGDVAENVASLSAALKSPRGFDDDSIIPVKTQQQVAGLDGLVIPGGESTAIGKMAHAGDILDALRARIQDEQMPVLGICAGLIMLAKSATSLHATGGKKEGRVAVATTTEQPLLGILDVDVHRNAFGRQRQSFETNLDIKPLSISKFKGVFIRAPVVSRVADDVSVLCELGTATAGVCDLLDDAGTAATVDAADKTDTLVTPGRRIVAVAKDNIIGTAFHPELSKNLEIHKHFVDMTRRYKRG